MTIMVWNDSFLLGIQEFDDHHRHLVGLINSTYDEYSLHPDGGNLEEIIKDLVDYAAYHFTAEERWLNEISYPEIVAHQAEHRRFAEQVAGFQKDFLAGQATSAALFFFLVEWLTNHIQETDAEYARFNAARAS